ncbi:SET and MYND domain-containing protein 4-like isoform X2 [Artemia franciscana]|uniref:SET and MYND domain-containing protein 4-like isoform X2 n=1 Tax=Artemia franciscana TaxID=6661 RepID=UPI0032D9AE22
MNVKEITEMRRIAPFSLRILLCWSLPATHEYLTIQSAYQAKDPISAADKRNKANQVSKTNPEQALSFLNQSVIRDKYGSSSISQTLYLRSSLLLSMFRPDLALQDAQAALKGIEEDRKYLVYILIGDCISKLKQNSNFKKAEVAYKVAENLAAKLKDKIKLQVMQIIKEKLVTLAEKKLETEQKPPREEPLHLLSNSSQSFQGAFDGFDLKASRELGRYGVTNIDVDTGSTVIVEGPYASVLNSEKYGTYCLNCLERLTTAFPCPWCRSVGFCSEKCCDAAIKSYHLYECQTADIVKASGMSAVSRLALRMVTWNDLSYFKNNEAPEDKLNSPYSIKNLVGHTERREAMDLFNRTMMTIFLLKLLKFSGYFLKRKNTPVEVKEVQGVPDLDEDELLISSLLLRNLQILQFNAHEVTDLVFVNGKGLNNAKSHSVGLAIYQIASLLNHSCYPNVARYFSGTKLVIRALRKIPSGEPILDNYGPLFTHKSIKERKRTTNGRYWFDCQCDACYHNWPTYRELEEEIRRISCSKCRNIICGKDTEAKVKCTRCGESNNLKEKLEQINQAQILYQDATTEMDRKNIKNAISLLQEAIKLVDANVCPPVKILHLAQDKLRLCFCALGSTWNYTVRE